MPAERGKPDSRGLNFFDITDFSPGIYDNSVLSPGFPNTPPGVMPAPPGAADVRETFGCISENNGGLGPLPALGGAPGPTGLSMNDIGQGLPAEVVGPADITAVTNSFQNGEDELVFMLTYDATVGVSQSTAMWSYNVGFDILNLIPGTAMAYNYSADLLGAKNYCCFPFMTLVLAQPELVFALAAPSGPNPNLFTYPNVGTSTVFSSSIITSDQTANGTSIGHQGRMLVIAELQYGWPVAISTMPNESFNYTDPALFLTWPMQKEVFGPENPFGFGAVNSVSAGELFCVKRRGGAIIIQGDLNNPTVTTLPGVKSTGQQYGRTDTDQNGMYYAAEHAGAWVWNGGNTSQKISNQLEDDFYLVSNPIEDSVSYAYYFQRWGSWMMCSNNWIYNSDKGAWWRLEDPAIQSYYWYVPGWLDKFFFALKATVVDQDEKFLFEYNKTIPRSSFTWQSLPIKLPSEDRLTSVRQLVIRASNPYVDTAPSITATFIDDHGNVNILPTWNMDTDPNVVQEFRINARTVIDTTTIAVKLSCSGEDFAPVVHGLSIGYRPRQHTGAN